MYRAFMRNKALISYSTNDIENLVISMLFSSKNHFKYTKVHIHIQGLRQNNNTSFSSHSTPKYNTKPIYIKKFHSNQQKKRV